MTSRQLLEDKDRTVRQEKCTLKQRKEEKTGRKRKADQDTETNAGGRRQVVRQRQGDKDEETKTGRQRQEDNDRKTTTG